MFEGIRINKDAENPLIEELMEQRLELISAGKESEIIPIMEKLFVELMDNALLMTAINMSQPSKKLPNGEQTLAVGTSVSFPMVTTEDGENYMPMFTKRAEMEKWNTGIGKNTVLMGFDNFSMIVDTNPNCAGIVINPYTHNLVIPRRFVEDMKERRDILRDGQTNRVLKADTPCELYTPAPYPMEMSNALTETAKGTGAINSLWLRGVKLDGQDGYLLVVDFKGDKKVVFSRLGQAARPFLSKKPMHIVERSSGFGENAVKNVVPFYTRN